MTRSADVSVVKTGPASITANSPFAYTLRVGNAGPSQASGVVVSDTLPTGYTFLPSAGCTAAGQVVTCTVGTVAVGATPTVTLNVQAPSTVAGTVANTATVVSDATDPNTSNNSSTFTSGGTNVADVSVTKSFTPATLVAGNTITYTMVVSNSGPSPAGTVVLTDTVPTGVTITGVSATNGATCDPAPAVRCTAATLAASGTYTVTAIGTIAASTAGGTTLSNTATVTSNQTTATDPTTSNNSATASGVVTTAADVAVTLTATTPTIAAGTIEHYVLHVQNNGPRTRRTSSPPARCRRG